MKITNKYNLPEAMVDLVQKDLHEPSENYGVTTLLKPTRMTILERRHWNEMEEDVSNMVNVTLGSAVHSLLEKMDKTGFAEMKLKEGKLVGVVDLYDKENFTIVDYKTATCWKIIYKDFDDWKWQGLMYAHLLTKAGHYVKALKFHAILKDWSPRDKRQADLKGNFYPETQVYTWYHEITTEELKLAEDFINQKLDLLERAEKVSDDELYDCEDTWYTGDKYAVYKKSTDARAQRILDTEEEAKDYITNKMNGVGEIVYRQGEHRRCQDYCPVCKWCKYYEARKCTD